MLLPAEKDMYMATRYGFEEVLRSEPCVEMTLGFVPERPYGFDYERK